MKGLFKELRIYLEVNNYCELQGECKELEQLIATNCAYSYNYAQYIINKRFKLGEELIMSYELYKIMYQAFLVRL